MTVLSVALATQRKAPSKAKAEGLDSAELPSTLPSLSFSLLTFALAETATQRLTPSKARPWGPLPTA